jgi:antitoxin component HigA of HigAB toxin-antitoxin module
MSGSRRRHLRDRMKEFLNEYRETHSCVICAESESGNLDFHHFDPSSKKFNVSNFREGSGTWADLINEISKCVILCKECHRKVHADIFSLYLPHRYFSWQETEDIANKYVIKRKKVEKKAKRRTIEIWNEPKTEPRDFIKAAMVERGLVRKDLLDIFGTKGRAAEILNGVRAVPRSMAVPLSERLGIELRLLHIRAESIGS